MTIKLVKLLYESLLSEASNIHPVYDEYLTNPQSGKKLKVKSALASKTHPMYQTALTYIKDKTGSDHGRGGISQGTEQNPDVKMSTGEVSDEYETTSSETFGFKDEANKEATDTALETITQADEKIAKHTSLTDDKEKWESLSDDFRKAAIVSYRDEERSKNAALQSVIDTFKVEGVEPPPEIQANFEESNQNLEDIEDDEANEAAEDEEGKSWTQRFNDQIDDKAMQQFDEYMDAPEEGTKGI
jgi:hypothetical protein